MLDEVQLQQTREQVLAIAVGELQASWSTSRPMGRAEFERRVSIAADKLHVEPGRDRALVTAWATDHYPTGR